ncbi:MAG: adenylyltransferase/cytidyltransferase family protein [Lachnospiraceae bacterium]|nr:adenylyltransferase/cytidyltransferase family protein [Lachnospiraceae bacterium]
MVKVITYGTFDMLHHGHIRLLERAKALGDYLIVGVTSDDYDKTRGKINLRQTLMERIEAVKATGIPDEVIVEEYEGQKIDDIRRYGADIFTVGSDWEGYFDYLNEYCKVVYLERTEGVSSSEIRGKECIRLGLVGSATLLEKVVSEAAFVNGLQIAGICTEDVSLLSEKLKKLPLVTTDPEELYSCVDAVYVHSYPAAHYAEVKAALQHRKHVLCESPLAFGAAECRELMELASSEGVTLTEAVKTAYSTAYQRMVLLVKSGKIGHVVSVDSTCTSLKPVTDGNDTAFDKKWNSLSDWGPTGLLPVFQILGTEYVEKRIISHMDRAAGEQKFDLFSKVDFVYPEATASVKVGRGVKSEGELVISGTKGYVYVAAPWWKTDYFEVRFENPEENKRYFYQLDGEGIRNELVAFTRSAQHGIRPAAVIDARISEDIAGVMGDFETGKDLIQI